MDFATGQGSESLSQWIGKNKKIILLFFGKHALCLHKTNPLMLLSSGSAGTIPAL